VASNDTEDGRRRNRRIEIILLPAGQDEAGDS
jgi:flagellar motor protein MotB